MINLTPYIILTITTIIIIIYTIKIIHQIKTINKHKQDLKDLETLGYTTITIAQWV